MVKYTCEKCGAQLHGQPGTHEDCPACYHSNAIPRPLPSMFARIRGRWAAAKQARAVAKGQATAEARARAAEAQGRAAEEELKRRWEAEAQADAAEARARAAEEERQRRAEAERQARAAEEKWQRRAKAARVRLGKAPQGPGGGQVVGILLIVAGIITVIACLGMDVSVEGHIANLDKMNQRLLGVVIGVGVFIAGVVTVCLNSIHCSLWKIAGGALADLKDHSSTKG